MVNILGCSQYICTAPASKQLKKRFSTVDIDTLTVSKAAGPLFLSKPWTLEEGSPVSPTFQRMGKTEATVTALEGLLGISSKAFPGSSPCSLQGRLWLSDFTDHTVHLWCVAAASRLSAHAGTSPSLVLQGVEWPLSAQRMAKVHVCLKKECISREGVGTDLFPCIRFKINSYNCWRCNPLVWETTYVHGTIYLYLGKQFKHSLLGKCFRSFFLNRATFLN